MALKQYILIKDTVDNGHAIVATAHASLAGYLKWKDDPIVQIWVKDSFRKVVCRVTQEEFEWAKLLTDSHVMTESSLDNAEVAIVLKPREEWDRRLKFFTLWK